MKLAILPPFHKSKKMKGEILEIISFDSSKI